MPTWLRFLRGCIRPDVQEFSGRTQNDAHVQNDGPEQTERGKALAKRSELLSGTCDQASGTSTDGVSEPHIREIQTTTSLARRRSSSNVGDTLAPLAEDEALASTAQGLSDDVNQPEAHWNERASRSSCPTLVARGCSSATGPLEPLGPQPILRPHSLVSGHRNGFCVSPVSAATARSVASPMRHDFMTLMRQASNRGSSSGVVTDPASPAPQPFGSPYLGMDGCRVGAVAHRMRAADWAAATTAAAAAAAAATARQTHSGDTTNAACVARQRRQRRASAFAAPIERAAVDGCGGAALGAPGGVAAGGACGGPYPPGPGPTGPTASTFSRCSSSPNMRNDGVLLMGPRLMAAHGGVGPLVHQGNASTQGTPSPLTPPTTAQQAPSRGGSGKNSAAGGVSGGGASVMLPPPPPGVLRACPGGGGRAGVEWRMVHPSHSPLRPRDLPPPATLNTAAAVAAAAGSGGAATHSASALPEYCTTSGGTGWIRRPASGQVMSNNCIYGSSYQQVRLLQQLREQHELYYQYHQRSTAATVAAAATAAAAAATLTMTPAAGGSLPGPKATAMASGADSEAARTLRPLLASGGIVGGKNLEALKWVDALLADVPASPSVVSSQPLLSPASAPRLTAAAAATDTDASSCTAGGGVARAARGSSDFCKPALASPECCCSEELLPDSPSAMLPSITLSRDAAGAAGSSWPDPSSTCGGGAAAATSESRCDAAGTNSVLLLPPLPGAYAKTHGRDHRGITGGFDLAVLARGGPATAGRSAAATVAAATAADDCSEQASRSSSATAAQGIIVESLGATMCTPPAATIPRNGTRLGTAGGGGGVDVDVADEAAAQAVLVMQNLLQRNVLPDGDELDDGVRNDCELGARASADGGGGAADLLFPHTPRGLAAASPQLGGGFLAHGGDDAREGRIVASEGLRSCSEAPRFVTPLCPRSGPAAASTAGGAAAGGAGGAAAATDTAQTGLSSVPEQLLVLPSRTVSPALDSIGSYLTTRSGTPLLISPQPSEHAPASAVAVGAVSAATVSAAGDCGGEAAALQLSALSGCTVAAAGSSCHVASSCNPSLSHIVSTQPYFDAVPPATPAHRGFYGTPSVQQRAPCQPATAAGGGGGRGAAEALTSVNVPGGGHGGGTVTGSAGGVVGGNPPIGWFGVMVGYGSVHGNNNNNTISGGCSIMSRGRSSVGAYHRGSSVFASESSLAAIALLRSAASNCVLPDDGGGGGAGGAGSTVPVTPGSLLGLDADCASAVGPAGGGSGSLRSITASTADPSSMLDTPRCIPLSSVLSTVAWPPPPPPAAAAGQTPVAGQTSSLPPPPLSPPLSPPRSLTLGLRPPSSPSSGPGAVAASPQRLQQQPADGGSKHSLRLEDGLVSDPLLLVDGLGQLSYMTSGAYAAVYRGFLEDLPVGIKFLASTSLDLNAPAVREALLGPGLEHENIIRTYTTRVARVDGRAVSQLRAVAAAMASMRRKRSSAGARRYSIGNPVACSPLSVHSSGSPWPAGAAAAAAGGAVTGLGPQPLRRVTVAAAPWLQPPGSSRPSACTSPGLPASLGAGPTSASPAPAVATDLRPRSTASAGAPSAAAAAANSVGGGGSSSGYVGGGGGGNCNGYGPYSPANSVGGRHQLPVAASPARLTGESVPFPSDSGMSSPQGDPPRRSNARARLISTSEIVLKEPLAGSGRAAAAAAAPSSAADDSASNAAASVRQMHIRKSVSANARAEVAGYCAPPPPPPASAMVGLRPACSIAPPVDDPALATAAAAAAATGSADVRPQRRALAGLGGAAQRNGGVQSRTAGAGGGGSAFLPMDGGRMAAQMSHSSQQPSMPIQSLPGGTTMMAAARGPLAPPRGSAAERMLDVLRTLGVMGPTGQPTAEAHFVTAVVMEFADAGNLDSLSSAMAPCDLATAVDLLRQVARGMSYLHAHGLVHGDLKPANVLLQRDIQTGRLVAKVADFGLSGLSGQLGNSGGADTCGTVAYSAPERLAEEACAEQAADVYSFGICMQQLVSGVRPFADLTFAQVIFSVGCLKMRPTWPNGRCGALEPLYDMCCHVQPAKRPTFDQVVAWLDSLWV